MPLIKEKRPEKPASGPAPFFKDYLTYQELRAAGILYKCEKTLNRKFDLGLVRMTGQKAKGYQRGEKTINNRRGCRYNVADIKRLDLLQIG